MLITEKDTLHTIILKVQDQLKRGLSEKGHPFRYVILTTISGKNQPVSRYVVLRGVDEQFTLKVFTDQRSSKVKQIENNDKAALLFYHPELKIQVRVNGTIEIHHLDKVALKAWAEVNGESKKSYNSTVSPGTPLNNPEDAHHWRKEMDYSHFAVLVLYPDTLDVLQISGHKHYRAVYSRSDQKWKGQWVAP